MVGTWQWKYYCHYNYLKQPPFSIFDVNLAVFNVLLHVYPLLYTYFDKISKIACIYRVFTLGSNIPNEKILMPVYTLWVAPTFNGLTFLIFDLFLKCHHFKRKIAQNWPIFYCFSLITRPVGRISKI